MCSALGALQQGVQPGRDASRDQDAAKASGPVPAVQCVPDRFAERSGHLFQYSGFTPSRMSARPSMPDASDRSIRMPQQEIAVSGISP